MSVTDVFLRKIKLEMRLVHIVQHRPRQQIKLQPLSQQDFVVSLDSVKQWSEDNFTLYQLILQNGMAEYICNKEFLFDFYQSLNFIEQGITNIDPLSTKFGKLKILNLVNNNITIVENIPESCKELYLDFNRISSIKNGKDHQLQLLSLSHNDVTDKLILQASKCFPELRCLNVSHNNICDLKQFVTNLASFSYLKILVAYQNPISMLKIYYTYITDHLQLSYIDGAKYVKEEPPKPQPVKVEQKKEVKQEKKDAKKDNKKGAKVEEKPVQQPKVEIPPPVVKKQLTSQDFERVKINVTISNLQQYSGNAYDASLFPADVDPKKTQTCYWIRYKVMGKEFEQKQKIISFDNTVVEADSNRINLQCSFQQTLTVTEQNLKQFNEGLKIQVCQVEPKMTKDPQTLQLKPEIKDNQVVSVESVLGGVRVDFRSLHLIKDKSLALKHRLFNSEVANNPFFYDPFENEEQIINSKKQEFQKHIKKMQEEKQKKAEQEQLLKQQKKGGKDQKKAADKKAGKKEGKDVVVQQKKKAQKCQFPVSKRLYVAIEQTKISKGKELLCIDIKIQ